MADHDATPAPAAAVPDDLADILEILTTADGPLTVRQLATQAGVSRATASTSLDRLAKIGRAGKAGLDATGPGRPAARWAAITPGTPAGADPADPAADATGDPDGATAPATTPDPTDPDTAPDEAAPGDTAAPDGSDDTTSDEPLADTDSEPALGTAAPQPPASPDADAQPDMATEAEPDRAEPGLPSSADPDEAAGEQSPPPTGDVTVAGIPVQGPVAVCAALTCPLAACPIRTGTGAAPAAPRSRARAAQPPATGPAEQRVNGNGSARMRPGQLAGQVLDYLRANDDVAFTPGEIARELVRSSGAVANALASLAGHGAVTQVSDKPRRYQHLDGAANTTAPAATA
ncbi:MULTISPECIES: winged helix-turn-helix domain-containing protein [Pseudofrankia]|uniref:winged helix-turn-helix domain-containing protein n=1 Tax=Pseudofrankia TaxID=2994363 RepID=UPI000234BE94|nr:MULTISPECIES: winged helix-turn-helix domain-containing protein [Pseudofrankia]OHV40373.1 hypothetical protein BCD49_39690 [Pseudofrankia sp. EUN1h]